MKIAAALALAAVVVPGAVMAQVSPAQQGGAQPGQINFPYPERLGEFVLVRVTQGPGTVGARYERPGAPRGSGGVDIFATPNIPYPPAQEIEATEQILPRIYNNLAVVRPLAAPPGAPPGTVGRLWRAELVGNPVLTGMLVAQRGVWQIKIRGTVPQADAEAGWARVEALMAAFNWTAPLPPAPPAPQAPTT